MTHLPGKDSFEQWTDEYELVDSTAIPHHDREGLPIPVTIPIDLAPGVQVVYTTRLGGSSIGDFASLNLSEFSGDDSLAVRSNRSALEHAVGAPLALVNQVHSAKAVDVDSVIGSVSELATQEADGLVSTQTHIALGVFAADCLPVLLADSERGIIAAAHCGRKGLEAGIIRSTVNLMVDKGAQIDTIVATLGPAICADCYELGEKTSQAFAQHFPDTVGETRFGGLGVDIVAAAKQALADVGVVHLVDSCSRITAATQYLQEDEELARLCEQDGEGSRLVERIRQLNHPQCTLENPLWYSHRRASLSSKPREGRMLALIVRTI